MGNLAQRKHHAASMHASQFLTQKVITLPDLLRRWLILRRQTFHRIGDSAIIQYQSIIGRCRFRLIAETTFIQCAIQQNSGMISRERSSGTVGAVHTGRQSHDEQISIWVTKRRYRVSIIIRVLDRYLVQKIAQPLAALATVVETRISHIRAR